MVMGHALQMPSARHGLLVVAPALMGKAAAPHCPRKPPYMCGSRRALQELLSGSIAAGAAEGELLIGAGAAGGGGGGSGSGFDGKSMASSGERMSQAPTHASGGSK